MAHLLGADRVTLTLGTRTLLDGVSLGVDDGMRVGVVGPNGAGKSTLLRVLSGLQDPDDGRVTRAGSVRVAVLDQRDDLPAGCTVLESVHGGADTHEWAVDARVRSVHTGLLSDLDLAADVATLSGGQRRRVALAALLVRDDEVLVLDEPTNHLDVEGVAWLAAHLSARYSRNGGALVVVTHDRWFLDAVCTRTWEVHDGQVDQYDGGYAAYVLARAERAQQAATVETKRQNLLRKELAWLRRGAPARTSKPQFRLDAAAALIADEPPPRDNLELTRMATARLGKDVLDVEGVTLSFPAHDGGPDRVLLDDVTWRLGPGDRIGLVGVNGAGKTSLLRLLTGRLEPTSGRVKRGKTVQVAELRQDVEDLDELADLRVVEVVEREKRSVVVGGKELTASQLVERLGFTRDRARTPVRDLSGGERRRLQLLRLLVGEPNVLLLDEPTNDLDTDTLAALEDLLDGWPGTLIVVSHDRYLLERVCDRQMALLGDGALRDLPGGVEQYLALRAAALAAGPAAASPGSPAPVAQQDVPTQVDAVQAPSAADVRAARKEIARVERRLSRISAQEAELHARMVEQATDHVAVGALDEQLRTLAAEKDELEMVWLEASEIAG
ncbi:ABC-F family ATP-binding cassette domain-containing protein [Cellulomonas soli]|uniref:ABC transporter ATP-binding protein n=1 Tax=Cellulomonas soli TaxID=931535 RepID=A0A512PH07_9CELL|nr:ABC-F family ATP-binding cassette domain-containing protein [Cellulomonas soli]NYI59683.1 ATPase subunit of ABC transporter with duplicated ATPase domains [Cellulomonas soli]GEP70477.1 ABC transporter ATP-binding protein [Cellulomonas soli]